MTIITLCRGRHVVEVFTQSGDAIMTTGTGAQYLEVIHGDCGFPNTARMAIITDIGRTDMLQPLAGRTNSIMTTATAFSRRSVVKACR